MRWSLRRMLIVAAVVAIPLVVMLVPRSFDSNVQIAPSFETTRVTAPVHDDGLPDLVKHLDDATREGVTAENNAALLLWQVIWPGKLQEDEQAALCDAIGLDPMPSSDVSIPSLYPSYFELLERWMITKLDAPEEVRQGGARITAFADEFIPIDDVPYIGHPDFPGRITYKQFDAHQLISSLQKRPWRSEQVPIAAAWLKAEQRRIDLIVEATRRPKYYSPSFLARDSDDARSHSPETSGMRECGRILAARAMWHLGEGRLNEAWRDTHANLKLARLMAQAPVILPRLTGYMMENYGFECATAILGSDDMTLELAKQIQADLENLSPLAPLDEAIDFGERLATINYVMLLAKESDRKDETDWSSIISAVISPKSIDWNFVLRELNNAYDRIVAAHRIEDRELRMQTTQQLANEFQSGRSSVTGSITSMRSRQQERSERVATTLMKSFATLTRMNNDDNQTITNLMKVSAALAVYRQQHGQYPDRLSELVPSIKKSLSNDPFSSQELIYERRQAGFLLYSVGTDETNDNGTDSDEILLGEWISFPREINGGRDVVVREPRPALRLPWPESAEAVSTSVGN